jgi:tetratricopeptide (TPR) repeat protein
MKRSVAVFGAAGLLILIGAVLFRPAAMADAPRIPGDPSEVLERLPAGAGDAREREQARLRRALSERPDDLATALTLAQLDIERSRSLSDPRYLGYAQAALARWWDLPSPPPEVVVLRATIRQSSHDFDGALADLDRALTLAPNDAQAWITRSVVLAVRGRYAEATKSCGPLARLAPDLVFVVCETSIEALTGRAADAYDRLEGTISRTRHLSPAEDEWARSTLGEIAVRLGRDEDAERHYRTALVLDPDDAYLLAAYADLLLDLGRPAEAVALVAHRTENDGLLLRLALAEARLHAPEAQTHAATLGARFDASRLRGDTVHRREESRFELGIRGNARAALALAVANWDVQREPWDARVLLEAALAVGADAAAQPVLAFLDEHHLEDPRITSLAEKLRAGSR